MPYAANLLLEFTSHLSPDEPKLPFCRTPVSPLVPASQPGDGGTMKVSHCRLWEAPFCPQTPSLCMAFWLNRDPRAAPASPWGPPSSQHARHGTLNALDHLNGGTSPLGLQGCNCHWDNCVWRSEPLRTALPAFFTPLPISSTPGH